MRWLFVLAASALLLRADGGSVILNRQTRDLTLTVFVSPSPPQAGPVDLSVLLQTAETLDPILNADIELTLTKGSLSVSVRPTHDRAQNKMLYAATVELNEPGDWSYTVTVQPEGSATKSEFTGALAVDGGKTKIEEYSVWLALPFVCLAVFAIHQWLRLSRPGAGNDH